MRKNIAIIIAIIMLIGMLPLGVYANTAFIEDLYASIENGVITITGRISTGEGKEITIRVKEPDGNLQYLNQTTSSVQGRFEFSFTLKQSAPTGTYTVDVGGQGISAIQSCTFEYEDSPTQPIHNSSIAPMQAEFDKKASAQQDITIVMTLNGNTLTHIKKGTNTLLQGTDYTVQGNTVTIKKEYLQTLSLGETVFTFVFSAGNDATLTVNIVDTTPVVIGVTGVSVSPTAASLTVGDTQQLTATITPANATKKQVSWATSNANVATVNSQGGVTAVGAGTVTITVTSVDNTATVATCVVTVTTQIQHPSDDDDDSDDSSSQVPSRVESNNDGSVTVSMTPGLNTHTQTATMTVDASTLKSAFNTAKSDNDGIKTVHLEIARVTGANTYAQQLPREMLSGAAHQKVVITSEVGVVTVPGNVLAVNQAANTDNITIAIKKVDTTTLSAEAQQVVGNRPVVELNMLADGNKIAWNNPDAAIQVRIPYQPTQAELNKPEHIVIRYIDGNGNIIAVPNGRYDAATKSVVFNVNHFSKYAIAFVEKTFEDITNIQWAKPSIEVLASKGIINGISETAFAPDNNITRADFLVLLMRTLGLNATFTTNFDDVHPTDYYYNAIGAARALGITNGVGNNMYNPRGEISRQEMLTLSAKALQLVNKLDKADNTANLNSFTDKGDIADYAVESIAALVKDGLVKGDGNRINPISRATRAEVAVFMYRIYNET